MSSLLNFPRLSSASTPPDPSLRHTPVRFTNPLSPKQSRSLTYILGEPWLADDTVHDTDNDTSNDNDHLKLEFIDLPNMAEKGFAAKIRNVLTPEECAHLIANTEAITYETATVTTFGNKQVLDNGYRNSGRCVIDSSATADEVFRRIQHLIPQPNHVKSLGGDHERWALTGINNRLRFLKYSPGGFFKKHRDGAYSEPGLPYTSRNESKLTMMLYLNGGTSDSATFEGGGTSFHGKNGKRGNGGEVVTMQPETGMVLLFEHPLVHSGDELVSGVKYAVRSDVMYKREPE